MKTLQIQRIFRVFSGGATAVAVKSIEVARRGNNFLINGSDRVLRVYDMDNVIDSVPDVDEEGGKRVDIEALQRLQDNVNRMQWKRCTFSGIMCMKCI